MKTERFQDRVKVNIASGRGGDGSASFRREKFVPRGGPDGGDGGRGGNVWLQACADCDSLEPFFYQPRRRAEDGAPGRGQRSSGRNGADCVLTVPCGTVAIDDVSGEELGEVLTDGERVLLLKGGRGGLGNCHFATAAHQAPREFTPGEEGHQRSLWLEFKTVTAVGLVGLPNAGKSTLLGRVTRARPKIAPYPFTTTHPVLGTLLFGDGCSVRVADMPGLIRDAHLGSGLGHAFLRHIERARLLILVIDMAAIDQRDPVDDYRTLLGELTLHRQALEKIPRLIAANKMDVPGARENLAVFRSRVGGEELFPMAAANGEGIPALRERVHEFFCTEKS